MYKIVSCFKVTDDYDELLPKDWEQRDPAGYPITDFVRRTLGCFDEAALENGLLLKEMLRQSQVQTQLIAVSLNSGYAEHIIKRLAAVGYDRVVCLETKGNTDFDPEYTAKLLAEFLASENQISVILSGQQTPPGNTGMVPQLLAEQLKMPLLPQITRFEMCAERIFGICEYETGYMRRPICEASVCVMGNTEKTFLRIPTMREKMRAKDFVPEKVIFTGKGFAPQIKFSVAALQRTCHFVKLQDAEAVYRMLCAKERNV